MSSLIDSARSAVYRDGMIVVMMDNGSEFRFPAKSHPRLARGTAAQISNIEISPVGLHWPDLDEDLCFRGILAGDYGQHQKVEPAPPGSRRRAPRRMHREVWASDWLPKCHSQSALVPWVGRPASRPWLPILGMLLILTVSCGVTPTSCDTVRDCA
jgi:hypothetical protein